MIERLPSNKNPFKPPQEVLDLELLYNAIFEPIRLEDKYRGREFLKRFLQRPEEWRRIIINKIAAIWDNYDPTTCPADLLQYLKDIVGFDSDFDYLTSRLSENDLRKLILLAVPLWKERFSEQGIRNVIQLLVGRGIVYYDWFDWRAIVGETCLTEDQIGYDFWLLGGLVSTYDEYYSQIKVMDDGTLDRQLLVDLAGLERVSSERFEVAVLDFLDYFEAERDKWTTTSGTPATIEDGVFRVPAGTTEKATINNGSTLKDYVFISKFKLQQDMAGYLLFYYDDSANNYYFVRVHKTVLYLYRVLSGGSSLLQAVSWPFPLDDEVWYKFRVSCIEEQATNDKRIKVYVDGNLLIDYLDTSAEPDGGPIALFSINLGGTPTYVEFDNVEVFRVPLRLAEVGPGDVIYSDNFFDP